METPSRSVPHAAARAATAIKALAEERTLAGRLMRAEIIRSAGRERPGGPAANTIGTMPSVRACKWLLAASLMLAWLASGCGRAPLAASGNVLRVALSDYRLSPRDTHADAGPLTILVHNYGRFPHNLALSAGGHLLEDAVVVRRIRVAGRRAGRVFNDDLRVRHYLILQPRDRFGREHDGISVEDVLVAGISKAQDRRIAQYH